MLRDSPLTAFSLASDLADAAATLRALGYRVVAVDAGSRRLADCLAQVATQVPEWPPGYATTLDGFHDGLRDLTGPATAFVFTSFDSLWLHDRRAAEGLLHSLVSEAWWHALDGRVLATLVHANALDGSYGGHIAVRWTHWHATE